MEYIGEEEISFVNMILRKLINKDSPDMIIKKVEKILDEDAEVMYFYLYFLLVIRY